LRDHLLVPPSDICELSTVDKQSQSYEDGITTQMEYILSGRKNDNKIDNWESLWRTIFPEYEGDIPSPGKSNATRLFTKLSS